MNNKLIKKGLLLLAGIALPCFIFGQFEGIIAFSKIKGTDTTYYEYSVKGNKVRIDENYKDGKTISFMLIDIEKDQVIGCSPDRKLYYNAKSNREALPVEAKVNKTGGTEKILGYDVTKWTVSCDKENTVISYWVAEGFEFFTPMLKLLNRKDRVSKYFLEIEDPGPVFTLKGEEKSVSGEPRVTLITTKIEAQKLEDVIFEIPKGFVEFER